jgi:uncharacterized membrane protein YozB (DUF420 family)
MGLFGNFAPVLADVNLILQIAMLVLLAVGWLVARNRRFRNHGLLMVVAFVVHTIAIVTIMVPSLAASRGIFQIGLSTITLVIGAHAIFGGLAEILGFYMVGRWVLNRLNIKTCLGKKTQMRLTLAVWVIALTMGVYSYFLLYPLRY